MNKRIAQTLAVSLALVLTCGSFALAGQEATVLSFGCIYSLNTPTGKAAQTFVELVKERSGGNLVIEYFPSEQLGTEQEMIESASMGAIDLTLPASGICGLFHSPFLIFTLPYVIDDWEHLTRMLESELGDELMSGFEAKTNIKVLARNWYREPRFLYGRKPVRTLDDLNGFRIRVPETPTYVEGWKRLGASPMPMALGEVYTALQTGAIDGAESTISTYADNGYYNAAIYFMNTSHVFETQLLLMNQQKFDSLSPEWQEILLQSAVEAGLRCQSIVEDAMKEELEIATSGGATILEVDRENWIRKMDGLAEQIWKVWGDEELYSKIRSFK